MAYDLNRLEIPASDELRVGCRDGWCQWITSEGIFVRPEGRSGLLRGRPSPSENLRTQLWALADQGYCQQEEDGSYYFAYADLKSLEEDDWTALYGFCGWLPCTVRLRHRHNLGHPEFRLDVDFIVGATTAYPELIGPFARIEGTFYLLNQDVRSLLDQVEALNRMTSDEKAVLPKVLRSWADVNTAADHANALRDEYLKGEKVVVPNKVKLDIQQDPSGLVSIVPTFDGVQPEEMHKAYLRENQIQDVYHTDDRDRGRVRVVLTEEVHGALEALQRYRRLGPKERDRLFSRPEEILPDGVDPNVIDLSLFGPRVRAIGEYAATVRLLDRSGRDWVDGEWPDDMAARGEDGGREIGLDLQFDDGSVAHEVFNDSAEVDDLLNRLDVAIAAEEPVVAFRGKKLAARPELRAVLEQARSRMAGEEPPEEQVAPAEEPPKRAKSKIKGPLVYENIGDREYQESDRPPAVELVFEPPVALRPSVKLKPHQEVGVGWLADTVLAGKHGALLADDMGLGKTLQALTFLAWLIENDPLESGISKPRAPWNPILVVAPIILLEVWREEIEKFFDTSVFLPYTILDSEALRKLRVRRGREGQEEDGQLVKSVLDLDEIGQNRLIITNYDAVANYGFSFAQVKWTAVISDESHRFKEPSTRFSQVMKSLNTDFRVAMTGTPVVNRLLDVWNLVDFLRPLLLGSQKEFRDTYELPAEQGGPAEGARHLKNKLRVAADPPVTSASVVLRRSKERELTGLPEKHERVIKCPISRSQRQVYVDLVRGVRADPGQGRMLGLLGNLNKLLQHPAMTPLMDLDASAKDLIAGSTKIQALLERLHTVRRRGEKALVFATYNDMQQILKRVLDEEFSLQVKIINGKTSDSGKRVRERRMQMITDFCEKPGFDVMVLSPDVAGVGLTITAANHVFHYGRWWNPAREDQATDRTYRIGQERDVFVYRVVATDPDGTLKTFDEHLDELIAERRMTSEQFLTPAPAEEELGRNLVGRLLETEGIPEGPQAELVNTSGALAKLSPAHFEALAGCLLEAEGMNVFVTPQAGDAGLDVIAISDSEVWCVQAKHAARRRNRVDDDAANQARLGATHYRDNILPGTLSSRTWKTAVITNGGVSRQLRSDAEKTGVELIDEGAVLSRLRRAGVSLGDVYRKDGERAPSIKQLRADLARLYG